tara:strand:- start:1159 stop:1575 length:417 start_codon:yes stop_codon:yes gene_type:complete
MNKLQFGKIDDNYIHDNLEEIVNLMTEILPEKASNSRNWRFNLKKKGSSDNLSYIGFAILNKFKHIYNDYDKRVDTLYFKEDLLEQEIKNQELRVPKLESQIRNLRDINYFIQEELISYMDERDYHIMMSEEFGHNKY